MPASTNAKPDVAVAHPRGVGIGVRSGAISVTMPALAVVALAMLAQLYLAFTRQFNWDEFFFLSHVFAFKAGALHGALQTFHVHLFGWLTRVPGTEADQIVAARMVMFVFEIGTLCCTYLLARRFVAREAAILAILAYASVNFVVIHGTAFRADPIATFLLMAGLAVLAVRNLTPARASIAGLAVALAGLVTIKSVFIVPAYLAVALWQLWPTETRRARLVALIIGALVSVIGFAGLFLLHRANLPQIPATGQTASALGTMTGKVFGPETILARWPYLVIAVGANPFAALLFVAGFVTAVAGSLSARGDRGRYLVALGLAIPMLTLFFYRNSFPYYYVFALAPAVVPAALAVERHAGSLVRLLLVPLLGLTMCLGVWQAVAVDQVAERQTLSVVHEMFPDPVAYIDHCGMVASFPKVGFFMSSWGIESYRAAGRPILRDAIANDAPPLVIANSPVLRDALMPGSEAVPEPYRLLATDAAALRANYVHYWGQIWLAGKRIDALGAGRSMPVSVLVPGSYTLMSDRPVTVDGRVVQPGASLTLSRGLHRLRSPSGTQSATLRWGQSLPDLPLAPDGPIFAGF